MVPRRLGMTALVAGLLSVLMAACSSSSPTAATLPAASTTTLPAVIAVGPNPSASSKMVCSREAEIEIDANIGIKPIHTPTATWSNHVYSCTYRYAAGVMVLSVKELSRASETTQYFDHLSQTLGRSQLLTLGQGAFIAKDDSAVVRKDYKVLRVDVTGLPKQFGKVPLPRFSVAANVAGTILGCWTGD